jgi:hypothetical protein
MPITIARRGGQNLKAQTTRRLAALLTGAALALSFPAAGVANKGGVPNSHSKPCKHKKHHHKKGAPNSRGKKCGFNG